MSWFRRNAVQPNPQVAPQGNQSYAGLTGAELARNPQYIDDQINAGFQQRYGRPPSPEELQQWRGYASGDTYSDGRYRVGWNPYLQDRLVTPGSEGASSVDPGMDTVVAGYQAAPGPGGAGQLGQFTGGGQYPLASYQGQGLLAPWTTPWQAPQLNETTDPGYKARFDLGKQGMEESAAARGTLLTGGFQKDLAQFAQDYASSEYDKVYGRARNEYLDAYNIYRGNANDQYNRLFNYGQMGLNAASSYAGNVGNLYTGIGNAQGAAAMGKADAYGNALSGIGNSAATLGAYWGTGGPSGSQTSMAGSTGDAGFNPQMELPGMRPMMDPSRYVQGENYGQS